MTGVAAVALGAAALFAVLDWVAVGTGRQTLQYVAKPAATAVFVLAALALDPEHADTRAWFVIALVLCLAGDVFLVLPRDAFVPGLGSFLLGHLAFTVGLLLHRDGVAALALVLLPVALVLGVRLVRAMRDGGHQALVGPVVAYIAVITVMAMAAIVNGNAWAIAGALVFMASDALIGETRFVAPRPWMPVTIMVTYHAALAMLVLSLLP